MKSEIDRACRRHGRLKIEYKFFVIQIGKIIFMQMLNNITWNRDNCS